MKRRQRNARAALVWALVASLALFTAAVVEADIARPELIDPLYSTYLRTLQQRRAERPDDATFLILGSSRVAMAFAPEHLPSMRDDTGRGILPFNFGQHGAGPLANLIVLRRLIDDGAAPDYLAVELMPAYLKIDCGIYTMNRVTIRDLPTAWRYLHPSGVIFRFARNRVRHFRAIASSWLHEPKPTIAATLPLGGFTYLEADITPTERVRRTQWAFHNVGEPMRDFEITPVGDAATRELVELCRSHAIRLTFILTPECPTYRTWYRPGAESELTAFLASLRADGVTILDARDWLDESDTYDSHHVLHRGAMKFTARFAEEVMQPLCGPPQVASQLP